MGIKRIVDTSFWTDGKVDEFSPEDKYFMLYLLTNPFSKQLGIYEISIKQAAFQMGYSVDAFKVLLERFETKYGMILFSKETSEIAILNFLRHSVMKGGKPVEDCIKKEMTLVKNKKLIDVVFSRLHGRNDLNETVSKIVGEYIKERGLSFNDNDNDNENENERSGGVSPHDSYNDSSGESSADAPCFQNGHEPDTQVRLGKDRLEKGKESIDYIGIMDAYNSICISLPSIKSLSEARKKAIRARLKSYSLEKILEAFKKAEASDFLKGKNDRNWQANFDWIIKDANIAKILDGNYDNSPQQKRRGYAPANQDDLDDLF